MNHSQGLLCCSSFHNHLSLSPQLLCSSNNNIKYSNYKRLQNCLGIRTCLHSKSSHVFGQLRYVSSKCHVLIEEKNCDTSDNLRLHVQTLRKFPVEKLYGEIAIVRIDSSLLLEQSDINSHSINSAISTISYLHNAGAKILLLSSWGELKVSNLLSTEDFSDRLSKLLQIEVMPTRIESNLLQLKATKFKISDILLLDNLGKFKEELTNCSEFCRKLSSGAYIFVNDTFSLSHKVLASTVGISRFCDASIAGFHFEEELLQLTKLKEITRQPYIAIIGGSKFLEKATALHLLASKCDILIFVGKMAFQIMHALGVSVPSCFYEHDAFDEALKLIQIAKSRSLPIYYPKDFWCVKNDDMKKPEIFLSEYIVAGCTPIDLGPVTLKEIYSLLSECKKVLWIGPIKFNPSLQARDGESKLVLMLEKISNAGCEVIVVGNAACERIVQCSNPYLPNKIIFKSPSVVWESLKGRTLPGVAALDREMVYFC